MPKVIIRQTTPPGTTLQVNGVTEGTHVAGSTIGINLSDGVNPVTPDSVTKLGDNYAVVLPACPPAVTRSTATLMKTGQTTSYRTGDDGDIEAGRATDFLTLDAAPVHNDGSATLNTTTNRFTDILGGSAYADDIVLDWSTWNGSTLLGYDRVTVVNSTWNISIDNALAHSIGTFTTGWRLINVTEALNIANHSLAMRFNYAPFNINISSALTTSTTIAGSTGDIWRVLTDTTTLANLGNKGSVNRTMYVRTFSLSTSNILS